MRKRLMVLGIALFAAGSFATGSATAEPSDACDSTDPAGVVQTANGGILCVKTGAVNFSLTADANPEGESYLVADGDSTNPDPLDGYIGLEGGPDGGGVVGCGSGDYEPFAGNVILGSDGTTPDPTTGPCAVALPEPPAPPV